MVGNAPKINIEGAKDDNKKVMPAANWRTKWLKKVDFEGINYLRSAYRWAILITKKVCQI
jgi:hypothetical protein